MTPPQPGIRDDSDAGLFNNPGLGYKYHGSFRAC